MLELEYTNQFKRDLKKASKRGKKIDKLNKIIDLLLKELPLAQKHCNHTLQGEYKDHWECHIETDWLLIYLKTKKVIILVRTGSHADLF